LYKRILPDKSQKVKSTRRNSGKFLCDLKHITTRPTAPGFLVES